MAGIGIELYGKQNLQINNGSERLQRIAEELKQNAVGAESTEEGDKATFADFLKSTIQETNELQQQADLKTDELIAGRNKDIHGTMVALEKADVSLRLLMQVRNKVIDAYREIMKMQI